ncbi:MAG: hypothetical protein JEZ06_16330 [Anaerolineaceae bacterium]|nr:hypothetical protein [Anaerolineaceae bacterium]
MNEIKQKLTLDRLAVYQIKVQGELDEHWSKWGEGINACVEKNDDGLPFTTLTCTFDQAALSGFLRYIYSLGMPLVSVICVDFV